MLKAMANERINAQVVKGLLDTLVLRVLSKGDNYGFAIIQDIEAWLGEDGPVLREATLYPLLHRLEDGELLEAHWRPGQRGTDRKYYRITPQGREYLNQRLKEWERVARILRSVLPEKRG